MMRVRTNRLKYYLFAGFLLVGVVIVATSYKQFTSIMLSETDLISKYFDSSPKPPENTDVHLQTTFTPPKIKPDIPVIEQYSLQINPDLFNYSYITPRDPDPLEIAAVNAERQQIEAKRCQFLKPYKYFHQVNWQNVTDVTRLEIPRYDNKYTIKPLILEGTRQIDPANRYQRVTIVTQLTIDRLPTLLFLLNSKHRAWPGRVSAAVFFENEATCNEIIPQIKQNWPQEALDRLDLHAVISHITVRTYPINFLRNIALNYVKTDFVFYLDVDFIPSENFLDKVPDALWTSLDTGIVWVSVAFHNNCTSSQTTTPSTQGTIPDWFYHCVRSHPTLPEHPSQEANYIDFWYSATEPYRVPYRPYFEPYIIGPRTLPPYDENFFYGADKVSNIYEVSAAGYSFVVMPDVFVEHFPHGSYSTEKKKMKYTANPPKKFCEVVNRVRCMYHFDSICTSEDVRKSTDDGFVRLRKHFKSSCGCGELYLPNS